MEATRRHAPDAPFAHLSTNYDYADPTFAGGIPETFRIDQSKHRSSAPPRWLRM